MIIKVKKQSRVVSCNRTDKGTYLVSFSHDLDFSEVCNKGKNYTLMLTKQHGIYECTKQFKKGSKVLLMANIYGKRGITSHRFICNDGNLYKLYEEKRGIFEWRKENPKPLPNPKPKIFTTDKYLDNHDISITKHLL